MNTGIQDALNLGWKLAFAPWATDCAALLDSYDREGRPLARQVLALTHLAFWGEAATSPLPSLLRGVVAPLAAPALPVHLRQHRLVAAAVRLASRLDLAYRDSPLSLEERSRSACQSWLVCALVVRRAGIRTWR
jgi:2-polyprenyl-6-methoxyphenol hydroxylase-like FAD-dependent oxidoreductase